MHPKTEAHSISCNCFATSSSHSELSLLRFVIEFNAINDNINIELNIETAFYIYSFLPFLLFVQILFRLSIRQCPLSWVMAHTYTCTNRMLSHVYCVAFMKCPRCSALSHGVAYRLAFSLFSRSFFLLLAGSIGICGTLIACTQR